MGKYSKIQIKVDVSKILGAFSFTFRGKTATKDCICIPKEHLYAGKDGALYLDLIGYLDERHSYGRIYSLKQSLNRAEWERLKASGAQLPFLGDVKALSPDPNASAEQTAPASAPVIAAAMDVQAAADDDLPF